jgi:hypothetical protein
LKKLKRRNKLRSLSDATPRQILVEIPLSFIRNCPPFVIVDEVNFFTAVCPYKTPLFIAVQKLSRNSQNNVVERHESQTSLHGLFVRAGKRPTHHQSGVRLRKVHDQPEGVRPEPRSERSPMRVRRTQPYALLRGVPHDRELAGFHATARGGKAGRKAGRSRRRGRWSGRKDRGGPSEPALLSAHPEAKS